MRFASIALVLIASVSAAASQTQLSPEAIEAAAPPAASAGPTADPKSGPRPDAKVEIDPAIIKLQVLLARARFSPGEIDGKKGENVEKAFRAFALTQGVVADLGNPGLWERLQAASTGAILTQQPITDAYVKGPFLDKMPRSLDDMKGIKAMSYVTVVERIAETFHISPELLRALNPDKDFDKVGELITVPNVAIAPLSARVARIEVDKIAQTVRAFDASGTMLAFYPATVGSDEKPTPSGELVVRSVTRDPHYRYNPDYKFKGVKAKEAFVITPGPNNPVGLIWIALSEKGYGIHGTPEPSKISKAESNGCVRLTNWDAVALGAMVDKGAKVQFVETQPAQARDAPGEISGSRAKRSEGTRSR